MEVTDMSKRALRVLAFVAILLSFSSEAFGTLQIETVTLHGSWPSGGIQQRCMHVRGLKESMPTVVFNGLDIPPQRVWRHAGNLCFSLEKGSMSGPIWLRADGRASNSVWLTTQPSFVLSPNQDSLAKIANRVVTAVDLVSLMLREDADGLEEARSIARRYSLEIVGAIPPLNVYQVRMHVRSVAARNAMLKRLRADSRISGVVVEDDNLEGLEDPERVIEPADRQGWVANNLQQAVELYGRYLHERGPGFKPRSVMLGVIEKGVNFDSNDFRVFAQPCAYVGVCLFARYSNATNSHGSIVSGILAARLYQSGNVAFLSRLGEVGGRFDIIVDRGGGYRRNSSHRCFGEPG